MKLERFAGMNMVYNHYSFDYFLNSMNRLGFEKFELWTGGSHINCFTKSLSDTKIVKQKVKDHKLTMTCLTPEQVMYPHNIATPNEELRKMSMEYFHSYIDMAAELEIPKMLCCTGWGDYDEDINEAWKRSLAGLNELTEHAEKAGVVLAFEILQKFETNLCNDFATTKKVMDAIDSKNFGLCVDTVPMRVRGNSVKDFFDAFGDRICHFHLTDGTPSGHVPAGLGDAPLDQYLAELDSCGYEGDITLEIGDTGWCHDPETATRTALDTVKNILKA